MQRIQDRLYVCFDLVLTRKKTYWKHLRTQHTTATLNFELLGYNIQTQIIKSSEASIFFSFYKKEVFISTVALCPTKCSRKDTERQKGLYTVHSTCLYHFMYEWKIQFWTEFVLTFVWLGIALNSDISITKSKVTDLKKNNNIKCI